MLTLILVFMEWPPRLHVLYIATAAAASFAYDPFRRYDMPELHEGKSMSVEREEGLRWSLVRLCGNPGSGKRISLFWAWTRNKAPHLRLYLHNIFSKFVKQQTLWRHSRLNEGSKDWHAACA